MQQNQASALQRFFTATAEAARENQRALLSAMLFGLAAHLFAFTNKLVNADEIESLFGKGATITSGRWGLEAVKLLFPDSSLPWLWGLVSLLLLSISVVFILRLFSIQNPLMQILLAGMITAFPSQTGVFCFMFTSTAYAISFLLSVLAVWLFCRGGWKRYFAAALCLTLSLGIYQAYVAMTASLFVLLVLAQCMDGERSIRQILGFVLHALSMMLLALLLYAGISVLVFSVSGAAFNDYVRDNVNPLSLPGRLRMVYDFLYYTLSYREFALISNECSRIFHLILLGLCLLCLFGKAAGLVQRRRPVHAMLMLLSAALLPLAVFCMFLVMDKGSIHTLVLYSFVAFYILAALLAERLLQGPDVLSRGGRDLCYLALGVALVSNIYLANMCYTKLYLQYENAYSFYSVLLTRVQNTEGYEKGCRLALIGHQDNAMTRFPEIDLGYLMGPSQDLVNIYSRERFLRYYLGTEIPLADEEETLALQTLPEFQEMGEYPYDDSIKKIGDVIIVKLG